MLTTVMCDLLPVLTLIDCVSVVLSWGRRILVFALVFVN